MPSGRLLIDREADKAFCLSPTWVGVHIGPDIHVGGWVFMLDIVFNRCLVVFLLKFVNCNFWYRQWMIPVCVSIYVHNYAF